MTLHPYYIDIRRIVQPINTSRVRLERHSQIVLAIMDDQIPSTSKRIRDENREENPRKKHASDSGEKMKRRNEKRKNKEDKPVLGNIKFYVGNEESKTSLYNKLDKAKILLGGKVSNVTNTDILNKVFDLFITTYGNKEEQTEEELLNFNQYLLCNKTETNQEIYLTTESSVRNLIHGVQLHQKQCDKLIDLKDTQRMSHSAKFTFMCQDNHTFKCDSSPYVEGGKYLVNLRLMHALLGTGLRYSQYERFCKAANIGVCPESYYGNIHEQYCEVTSAVTKEKIQNAIDEEVALTMLQSEEGGCDFKGINIMSDARHGTRRNAAQSDVIALGTITHKVVGAITITRADDPVSQRHELLGSKKLYEHFDSCDVNVNIHGHDRNVSLNKHINTEQPSVTNANDTWHAAKGITKQLKVITNGTKKMHGVTWHSELSDKAASIKTHCYYAMKNCKTSPVILKSLLQNIVEHYKGEHENCLEESRCKTDANYEPTKTQIKDSDAERILIQAIKGLQIYKNAEDYVHCIDTHYVESFNNVALVYHDKRISFGNKEYKRRTNMAVLDWNQNVDRDYTSITSYEDPQRPRKIQGHKNLTPKSFKYLDSLWERFMANYYHQN